jgi:hypothetical protein
VVCKDEESEYEENNERGTETLLRETGTVTVQARFGGRPLLVDAFLRALDAQLHSVMPD